MIPAWVAPVVEILRWLYPKVKAAKAEFEKPTIVTTVTDKEQVDKDGRPFER